MCVRNRTVFWLLSVNKKLILKWSHVKGTRMVTCHKNKRRRERETPRDARVCDTKTQKRRGVVDCNITGTQPKKCRKYTQVQETVVFQTRSPLIGPLLLQQRKGVAGGPAATSLGPGGLRLSPHRPEPQKRSFCWPSVSYGVGLGA